MNVKELKEKLMPYKDTDIVLVTTEGTAMMDDTYVTDVVCDGYDGCLLSINKHKEVTR